MLIELVLTGPPEAPFGGKEGALPVIGVPPALLGIIVPPPSELPPLPFIP